jgi:hypothetical protein
MKIIIFGKCIKGPPMKAKATKAGKSMHTFVTTPIIVTAILMIAFACLVAALAAKKWNKESKSESMPSDGTIRTTGKTRTTGTTGTTGTTDEEMRNYEHFCGDGLCAL